LFPSYFTPLHTWSSLFPYTTLFRSQVLQNVCQRVHLAFQAFFRRVKAGEAAVGYPRFKGVGRYDSLTYPQYGNGIAIRGNDLVRSEEHTSNSSHDQISYAVFCLKKK